MALTSMTVPRQYPFSALMLLVEPAIRVRRQEGHPACKKTEWWGAGVVICLERGADLHNYGPADATATHCLLLQSSPDWFYLSAVSGTDSPG